MGFWDAASRGVDKGIPLGIRHVERREDIDRADRIRNEDQYRTDINRAEDVDFRNKGMKIQEDQNTRAAAQETRTQKDYDINAAAKIANSYMSVARDHVLKGKDMDAIDMIQRMYKDIPNGDELRFILRANDKNGSFDGLPKDINVAVQSKIYGITTYKNMRDAVKAISSLVNAKDLSESMRQSDAKGARLNAEAKKSPFTNAADGKQYVETYERDSSGEWVPGEPVPFTGMKKAPPVRTGLAAELGKEPTTEQMETTLGIREKLPSSEKANKAQREVMTTKISTAIKAFTGKAVVNIFAGDSSDTPSDEVQGAVTKAFNLIAKAEKDGLESLSSTEKRLLPIAVGLGEAYESMFGTIVEAQGSPDDPLGILKGQTSQPVPTSAVTPTVPKENPRAEEPPEPYVPKSIEELRKEISLNKKHRESYPGESLGKRFNAFVNKDTVRNR